MSEPVYCKMCNDLIEDSSLIKAVVLEKKIHLITSRNIICSYCYEIIEQLITLSPPYHSNLECKKAIVMALHKQKYSIRQIQKILGYKSTRSVHIIIKGDQLK